MPLNKFKRVHLHFELQGETANAESSVWVQDYYNRNADTTLVRGHVVGRNSRHTIVHDVQGTCYTYSAKIEFREPNALLSLKDIVVLPMMAQNNRAKDN